MQSMPQFKLINVRLPWVMRDMEPLDLKPKPFVAPLVHGRKVIAYRVQTWVGQRHATATQVRQWLRSIKYSADEIESLFLIADAIPISASEVPAARSLAAYGIRG